jgi:hypothetical protein
VIRPVNRTLRADEFEAVLSTGTSITSSVAGRRAVVEALGKRTMRMMGSCLDESRGIAIVPMGTLDEDPHISPRANIFVDSKAPWFTITDDLPQSSGPPGSPPQRGK